MDVHRRKFDSFPDVEIRQILLAEGIPLTPIFARNPLYPPQQFETFHQEASIAVHNVLSKSRIIGRRKSQ